MSTSLLSDDLNIVGNHHCKKEYVGKEIRLTVEQDPTTLRFHGRGSRKVIRIGTIDRRFRAPCLSEKPSVQLVKSFFKNFKGGKGKLEGMKLARNEIRKDAFDHHFFWAPFILVAEVD